MNEHVCVCGVIQDSLRRAVCMRKIRPRSTAGQQSAV